MDNNGRRHIITETGGRNKPSYEHVYSAAHAVLFVLVVHDGPVVQQPLQQTNHQSDEVLARLGQVLVLPAVLQQTG